MLDASTRVYALSRLWQAADQFFPYFDALTLDWTETYRQFLPRAMAEQTDSEFYLLLCELAALLRDGHTAVNLPRALSTQLGVVPFALDHAAEAATLTAVPAGEERLLGARLLGLDQAPWSDWVSRMTRYVHVSHGHIYRGRAEAMLPLLLGPGPHALHTDQGVLSFALGPARPLATLSAEPPIRGAEPLHQENGLEICWLPSGKALYVKLDAFTSYPQTLAAQKALLTSHPSAVVLDLRDNIGGMTQYAAMLSAPFFQGRYVACRKRTRLHVGVDVASASQEAGLTEEQIAAYVSQGLMTEEEADTSRKILTRQLYRTYTDGFEGTGELANVPVALLTSRDTISAAEDFVAQFCADRRGLIIGQPTYGSTGTPLLADLGFTRARIVSVGYALADGTPFINQGIQPDIVMRGDRMALLEAFWNRL